MNIKVPYRLDIRNNNRDINFWNCTNESTPREALQPLEVQPGPVYQTLATVARWRGEVVARCPSSPLATLRRRTRVDGRYAQSRL